MRSGTLKHIPEDLPAQLKTGAEANYRTQTQAAMVRLDRNFAWDNQVRPEVGNRRIDESTERGPAEKFCRARFSAARAEVRREFAATTGRRR